MPLEKNVLVCLLGGSPDEHPYQMKAGGEFRMQRADALVQQKSQVYEVLHLAILRLKVVALDPTGMGHEITRDTMRPQYSAVSRDQ